MERDVPNINRDSVIQAHRWPHTGRAPAGHQSGVLALAESLKVNRALTSLGLFDNKIGAGGAKAIAAALPQS